MTDDAEHVREEAAGGRFIRNSVFLVFAEMLSKVLGLVFFAFLARFLGARELGLYSFGTAVANFFALAPKFGFERLAQKEIGRASFVGTGHLIEISVIKGIFSLVSLGLLMVTLAVLKAERIPVLSLIAVFIFTYTYLEYINSLFRGLKRAELEVIVRACFSVSNLALGIVILLHGPHLPQVVASQLLCLCAALLLALFLLKHFSVKTPASLEWKRLKRHVAQAAPFAGILLALYFSNQMGILALSVFKGESDVGYFAAAMKLFDNLTLIAAAVMGAFLPMMSELHGSAFSEAFSHALRFTMKHLFVLSAPIAVGVLILAEPLATFLYGSSFAPSAPSLRILGAALIFSYWSYAADAVLIAADKEGLVFKLTCLGAVVHVAANLALVPLLSSLGAAWATFVTQAVYFFCLLAYVQEYVSIRTLLHDILGPVLCALIMGLCVFALRHFHIMAVIVSGAAIYLAALIGFGVVSKKELKVLQKMLQRRKGAEAHGSTVGSLLEKSSS